VHLHSENLGIGLTWEKFWSICRMRQYDYILQQEDDVELLEPVRVTDMIEVLRTVPNLSQVVLKRQPWYFHEKPSEALFDDTLCAGFRGELTNACVFFTPITSLYPAERAHFDHRAWYRERYPGNETLCNTNPNEGILGKAFLEGFGLRSMHLKGAAGQNLIEHIGEYTIGKKLLPHEAGYEAFKDLDPAKKYWSGSGQPYEGRP
jgi:hypothetical protein